jgi:serine/threonine-protein kinase
MGKVFLGEAAGPGGFSRKVVIKVVRDEFDEGLVRALLDEARLTATLIHRNIVPVLALEEDGARRLVILEHVDGLDLAEVLRRAKRLPWTLAAFVAAEIAAGLDYAHRKEDAGGRPLGIVHRDVSPANILLSWEGEVKLTDFGVAKFRRTEASAVGMKGNLAYMAPEQVKGGTVGAYTDVFALGVVLYETLVGENPLRGAHQMATLDRVREGTVPAVPEVLAPRELRAIVARATAADPAQRFPTAAAMREALVEVAGQPRDPARSLAQKLAELRGGAVVQRDALLAAALGGGRPLTKAVRKAGPTATPARLSRRAIVAAAVVGAVAVAGAAGLVWRVTRTPTATPAPVAVVPPEPVVDTPSASPRPEPPPEREAAVAPSAPPVLAPDSIPSSKNSPPMRTRARARRGYLSVNAIPWAKVFLDGKSIGHTPRLRVPVDAGRHTVRLVTAAGDTRTRTVDVPRDREAKQLIS